MKFKMKKILILNLIMILLIAAAVLTACTSNKHDYDDIRLILDTTPYTGKTNTGFQEETSTASATDVTDNVSSSAVNTNPATTPAPTVARPTVPATEAPTTPVIIAPTTIYYEIPTVKPSETETTTAKETESSGVPYNPEEASFPAVPEAPAPSTAGEAKIIGQLWELTSIGYKNTMNKSFQCNRVEIGIKNQGSSTIRIFPNASLTVSNITGYDRELLLNNEKNMPIAYVDIPSGGEATIRFKVLGQQTLFSTQKDTQITSVHFTFYYGNTIYDATVTAGVDPITLTRR